MARKYSSFAPDGYQQSKFRIVDIHISIRFPANDRNRKRLRNQEQEQKRDQQVDERDDKKRKMQAGMNKQKLISTQKYHLKRECDRNWKCHS